VWISEDGCANTNAWADPAAVLPAQVMNLIDSLEVEAKERLSRTLWANLMSNVALLDDFAERTSPTIEAPFAGKWMPQEAVAHLTPCTIDELLAGLAALDLRWRIDAYETVEDYASCEDGK
jgi:hypothetical protein